MSLFTAPFSSFHAQIVLHLSLYPWVAVRRARRLCADADWRFPLIIHTTHSRPKVMWRRGGPLRSLLVAFAARESWIFVTPPLLSFTANHCWWTFSVFFQSAYWLLGAFSLLQLSGGMGGRCGCVTCIFPFSCSRRNPRSSILPSHKRRQAGTFGVSARLPMAKLRCDIASSRCCSIQTLYHGLYMHSW